MGPLVVFFETVCVKDLCSQASVCAMHSVLSHFTETLINKPSFSSLMHVCYRSDASTLQPYWKLIRNMEIWLCNITENI